MPEETEHRRNKRILDRAVELAGQTETITRRLDDGQILQEVAAELNIERVTLAQAIHDIEREDHAHARRRRARTAGALALGFAGLLTVVVMANRQAAPEPERPAATLPAGSLDAKPTVATKETRKLGIVSSEKTDFLRRACEDGSADACNKLGSLYSNGRLGKRDRVTSAVYFRRACDGDSMWGCKHLAWQHEHGHGVARSYQQAFPLYQKACSGGLNSACDSLARLYLDGLGVTKDEARAADLYADACEKSAFSCERLAWLYVEGKGVSKNEARARELFEKACSGGAKHACEYE